MIEIERKYIVWLNSSAIAKEQLAKRDGKPSGTRLAPLLRRSPQYETIVRRLRKAYVMYFFAFQHVWHFRFAPSLVNLRSSAVIAMTINDVV